MRTSTRSLPVVGVLGLATFLGGCAGSGDAEPGPSGSAGGPLAVVASTDAWGDVAATVGGDAVEVTSLVSGPSQDPHSYEASARDQLAVADAAVVIANGGGYDDFVGALVSASGTDAAVLDAVEISGRSAPEGGELNEHVWYDMPTVAAVADQVAEALAEADPGAADVFADNAEALGARLAEIEAAEASVADAAGGRRIVVTEPVPLYMTQACGLTDATPEALSAAVEAGTGVPATVLADTQALLAGGDVAALVDNEQTSGPETEALLEAAGAGGVTVVPVTETLPAGEDFVTWMTDNVRAIEDAVTS